MCVEEHHQTVSLYNWLASPEIRRLCWFESLNERCMCHPPEFGFVQHALGLVVGHTYQGLFVNGNELISRPQTSILHNKQTGPLVKRKRRTFCLVPFIKILLSLCPMSSVCMGDLVSSWRSSARINCANRSCKAVVYKCFSEMWLIKRSNEAVQLQYWPSYGPSTHEPPSAQMQGARTYAMEPYVEQTEKRTDEEGRDQRL